jgi:Glycosyltransferase 61
VTATRSAEVCNLSATSLLGADTISPMVPRGRELAYRVVPDAVALPLSLDKKAGVFEKNVCVDSSLLSRRLRWTPAPITVVRAGRPTPPSKTVDRPAVFAGYLFDHFGHFLLESLSRLWITPDHADKPLAWCVVGHQEGYTRWQQEVLHLLNVTTDAIFLDAPTRFSSLIVPEPGYRSQDRFEHEHANFIGAVDPAPVTPTRRCWVSRSKLPGRRYGDLENEKALESHLAEHGWDILHPEDHPVARQLELMSSSALLAGTTGSAFHSLILLKELRSRVVLIQTRLPNDNYATIASVKGFRQRIIPTPSRYHLSSRDAPPGELTLNDLVELWTGSKYPSPRDRTG